MDLIVRYTVQYVKRMGFRGKTIRLGGGWSQTSGSNGPVMAAAQTSVPCTPNLVCSLGVAASQRTNGTTTTSSMLPQEPSVRGVATGIRRSDRLRNHGISSLVRS